MKSYFETLKADITYHESRIRSLKKSLLDKVKVQKSLLLWEIGTLIEDTFTSSISVHCSSYDVTADLPTIQYEVYEDMLDEIDDIMACNGYDLQVDLCEVNGYNARHEFCYQQRDSDSCIYVRIGSSSCKMVETGKLVPEKKAVCNLFT